MPERCDRCGKTRVLQEFRPNQNSVIRICVGCLKEESDKRSAAATGKAGRPPKSPSQLEDQLWKSHLSSVDSKTLEMELTVQGHKGTRGQMLKSLLLAIIAKARKRA